MVNKWANNQTDCILGVGLSVLKYLSCQLLWCPNPQWTGLKLSSDWIILISLANTLHNPIAISSMCATSTWLFHHSTVSPKLYLLLDYSSLETWWIKQSYHFNIDHKKIYTMYIVVTKILKKMKSLLLKQFCLPSTLVQLQTIRSKDTRPALKLLILEKIEHWPFQINFLGILLILRKGWNQWWRKAKTELLVEVSLQVGVKCVEKKASNLI